MSGIQKWAKVGIQLWVCETQFIVVISICFCIIYFSIWTTLLIDIQSVNVFNWTKDTTVPGAGKCRLFVIAAIVTIVTTTTTFIGTRLLTLVTLVDSQQHTEVKGLIFHVRRLGWSPWNHECEARQPKRQNQRPPNSVLSTSLKHLFCWGGGGGWHSSVGFLY